MSGRYRQPKDYVIGKLYRVYTDDLMNSNQWSGWENKDSVKTVVCHLFHGDIVMLLEQYKQGPHFKFLTEEGIVAWFYFNPYFYNIEEAV